MERSTAAEGRRGLLSWLGAAVLNVLAALGLVCIVLVILAVVFHISIMMFRTGSMSPTITAGSIAFVKEIPATEMKVGDVVTAERGPDVLPVTHRVIDILETDEKTGRVTFEMRGDANDVKDPEPYTEVTVRRVLFSVPGIAPVIQQFRNPYILGGITIAASFLVGWAFWPRREDDEDTQDDEDNGGEDGDLLSRKETETEPETRPDVAEVARTFPSGVGAASRASRPSSGRTPKHAVVLPVVLALAAGGVSGALPAGHGTVVAEPTAASAWAPTGSTASASTRSFTSAEGRYLRLRAFGNDAAMLALQPGGSADWTVDVWADAPEPGTVTVTIGAGRVSEPLAERLLVDVRTCAQLVSMTECRGGADHPVSSVPLADLSDGAGRDRTLFAMPADEKRRVQVTVTLDSDTDARTVAGQTSGVRVSATGMGDRVSVGPDPVEPTPPGPGGELPWTGADGWQWLLIAGFALIAAGVAAVGRARVRGRS